MRGGARGEKGKRRTPRRLPADKLDELSRRLRDGGSLEREEAEDLAFTAASLDAIVGALTEASARLQGFLVRRGLWEACDREMGLWRLRGEAGPRQTTVEDVLETTTEQPQR